MEMVPEFLRDDYRQAAGNIMDLQTPEYFAGNTVADMNPYLSGAIQGAGDWGNGLGGDMLNQTWGAAQQGLGAIGQGLDYMQGMQERGPNQFQYDQGTYDQSFTNLTGGLQNQFDLGALQMQQNFDWNQLPGLNMQNALGGGQGNTKFGQQGALGQAMTNQNIANFGTQLWTNAANQANQGAMQAGMQNLNSANMLDQNMIQGFGQMGQLGGNLAGRAFDMGLGNLNLGLQAGQLQQGYDQSLTDADVARHNFGQQAPWIAQRERMDMLNSTRSNYTPGTPGMSPWEGAMQGAQGALGLYNGMQNSGMFGGGGNSPYPARPNGGYAWENMTQDQFRQYLGG
jgi:hypothetical protein